MAMDGFSARLLLDELTLLYRGAETEELPELPISYAAYAADQARWLQSPEYQDQLAYWTKRLEDFPKALDLPTDFPPPAQPSDRGATHSFALTADQSARLRAYCAKQRTTPYVCYLSALFVVLYRYTQQDDLIVGMPVSVRNQIEIENLIGYFANQLPIRCQIKGDGTFSELLRAVTQRVFEALDQQDIPYDNLLTALLPERSLSYTPLFRVIMVLHKQLLDRVLLLPACSVQRVPIELDAAKLDIYWTITDSGDQFAHHIEFSTDLFSSATIERLAEHVQTVLVSAIETPEQQIARVPLMTAAELQRLLVTWNATEQPYSSDESAITLLARQVERTPDAVAFYHDVAVITYAQLNRRINQLAQYLLAMDIQPEALIGVCLEPSFEMIVAILAIMKAGAAYVPLDPAYPTNRRALMITTAGIRVVITMRELADKLPDATLTLIALDADAERIALCADESPSIELAADRLAYVLFTSGSTGVPKGVMGVQRGIMQRLSWMWAAYPFAAGEVGAIKTSLNFIDSIWEFCGPLLRGLPSVIISQEDRVDPMRLVKVLARHRVTRIILVPTLLEAILLMCPDLQDKLPDLRFWVVSGEALPPDLVASFAKAAPHADLYNIYGTSETWDITCYRCTHAELASSSDRSNVPIGKPIHNVKTFVLDAALQPVPIGVVGELFVGGEALARGYIGDSAMTDGKFMTLPLPEPRRVYRTGDLAKYLPDGTLIYLGRADTQVKLRGFRVELSEIETVLRMHPRVAAGAVVMRRGVINAADQLIGYVVFKTGQDTDLNAIRGHLRANLPEYMVPAQLVVLDRLPMTPSGKIDRRALPAPSEQQASAVMAHPTDEIETRLLDLWQGLLHTDAIGIHDSFFECGGNSLLAIQLITRINRQFKCELAVSMLFHTTTIAQFASLIRTQQVEARFTSLVTIRQVEKENTAKMPIFCFHALLGNVLFYNNVIQHVPAEVPIYGFQAQGLDGKQAPLNNIEQLAEEYTAEILRVKPTGPYCLIGYSMGGKIALEVGRRLLARGQAVPLLLMIDDVVERNGRHRTQDGQWRIKQQSRFKRLMHRLESIQFGMLHLSARHRAAYMRERWRALRGQQALNTDEARPTVDHLPAEIVAVCEAMYYAVDTYLPKPYAGHITFIRAQEDLISIPRFQELHRMAAGGFTIYDLPGRHLNIVHPPYAEAVARKIAECYQAASTTPTLR
jgi:amino acid adenylation domain-containing protein